jgi:uncharacterized protein (DUF1330 family)
MAANVIVDVAIHDPVRYREYVESVPPTIAAYGGRFLVRGGRAERLEGTREPKRVVVLEFDSVERAKAWWGSSEYAGPKRLRQSASAAEMIVVEGV